MWYCFLLLASYLAITELRMAEESDADRLDILL